MWFKHFMLSFRWRTKSFLPFKHLIVAINFTAILFDSQWHLDKIISFTLIFTGTKMNKKVKFMDVSFLFRGIGWPFVIQKLNWRKKVVRIDIKMRNLSLTQQSLFTDETKDNMSLKTFKVSKNTVNAFFRGFFSNF
jgi:hypothetical protein